MRIPLTLAGAAVAMLAAMPAHAQMRGGTGTGAGMGSTIGSGTGRVTGVGPSGANGSTANSGPIGDRLPGTTGSILPSDGARRSGVILPSLIPSQGPPRTGLLGGESYEAAGVAGRPRPGPALTGRFSTDQSAARAHPGTSSGLTPYEATLQQAGEAARGGGDGGFGSDVSPSGTERAN